MDLYGRRAREIDRAPVAGVAPCPVCDAGDAVDRFRVDGVEARIVECRECGLARFHPMLGPEELAELYPSNYYGDPDAPVAKFHPLIEGLVRRIAARHAAFLARGLEPGSRVLDVGCGRGVTLTPLADRGLRVHGLEVNAAAVRGADPRAEIAVADRLRDVAYPDGSFDQVIIWHVLEHLADPRETLEECHRILAPGGRLVVAVPNFASWQARWSGADWFHLDPPRHLYHFPTSALRRLLERTGFDCRSEHHLSLRQNPFGWIQSLQNRFGSEPNRLYCVLQGRNAAMSLRSRLAQWLHLMVLAAPAVALSLLAAALRRGATVHVVAVRSDPSGGN